MKELSIIILNWNGKEVTSDCLNSLKGQIKKSYEVIVVDNDSKDGSAEYLKKHYSWIRIIQSKENLGYAGGNNLGVKKSRSRYVLILNNDTVLDKNFLKELMNNKDKADILGVKSYYYDKKNTLWAIGSTINTYTMKGSLVGNKEKDSKELDQTRIEQVVGCAMLINRKVTRKVGFLDERYFCYYEETEWQTRAKKAGFTISWVPTAKLWHRVGYSTGGGRTPLSAYYLVRNRAYYIEKHGTYKIIAYPYWMIEVLGRAVYGLIKGNVSYTKMSIKGLVDYLRNKRGKLN